MSAVANVVRAEIFKAAHKKRTYVLAGLYWVLLPLAVLLVGRVIYVNLTGTFLEGELPVDSLVQQVASPYGIARIALVGPAYMSPSFYMIIVALFAALLVGEERSQNMWKTTLVAQPGRLAVLTGKFIVAWLAFAVLVAGGMLFGFLFGAVGTTFLGTDFAGDWTGLLQAYGLQVLFASAAIAFAFLLLLLFRGVALGMVTVFFLPALLEGLYTAYATLVGFQPLTRFNAIFQALRLQDTLENLPRYFFTTNLYAPSRRLLGEIVGSDVSMAELAGLGSLLGTGLTLQHSAMVMAGYFAAFALLTIWLFLRRDIA